MGGCLCGVLERGRVGGEMGLMDSSEVDGEVYRWVDACMGRCMYGMAKRVNGCIFCFDG